jgi:lipopolysaccharide export system permease protein
VQLLTAYLVKDLVRPALVALFVMVAMIWLMQSLRFMDLIINRGIDPGSFLWLTVLLVPSLLLVIMPIAFFVGGCFSFKRLAEDNELDAIFVAGIDRVRLMKPALVTALAVVLVGYVVSLWALPAGKARFKDIQHLLRSTQSVLLLEEGTFNPVSSGLMVYLKKRDRDGTLHNLLVHDNRDKNSPVTWTAQEGRLTLADGKPALLLVNGARLEVNAERLTTLAFTRHTMDITQQIKFSDERFREADERSLPELFERDGISERDARRFEAELHRRLIWPLTPLPLILIAGVFLLRPRSRRVELTGPLSLASAMAVLYQGALVGANSLSTQGLAAATYGQWFLPIAACAICLYALQRKDCA